VWNFANRIPASIPTRMESWELPEKRYSRIRERRMHPSRRCRGIKLQRWDVYGRVSPNARTGCSLWRNAISYLRLWDTQQWQRSVRSYAKIWSESSRKTRRIYLTRSLLFFFLVVRAIDSSLSNSLGSRNWKIRDSAVNLTLERILTGIFTRVMCT